MPDKKPGFVVRKKSGPVETDTQRPGTKASGQETAAQVAPPHPHPGPAAQATPAAEAVGIDATLLANFTHQIINPLNGVVGTLDNLIDGTIGEERRDQRLRAVRAQLLGTIELVRNLAYLSQLSTQKGREGLKSKAIDVYLPQVIIEAAQFLQEFAERKRIAIRLTDAVTQYVVKGHQALLRQVFTNIIENGVKYSDEATRIEISEHEQTKTGQLLVEVASFGPGFAAGERERLFELGYRGSEAQNIRASGSGLGLFICRQILSLHDATIEAEYSPSTRRTVFRIRFSAFRVDDERTEQEENRDR